MKTFNSNNNTNNNVKVDFTLASGTLLSFLCWLRLSDVEGRGKRLVTDSYAVEVVIGVIVSVVIVIILAAALVFRCIFRNLSNIYGEAFLQR